MTRLAWLSGIIAALSYQFMDVNNGSVLTAKCLPVLFMLSSILFFVSLAVELYRRGIKQTFGSTGGFTDID